MNVKVQISDNQILRNDLLFMKVILVNNGERKIIKQSPSIERSSLKLYLKRPEQSDFHKIEYEAEGTSEVTGESIPFPKEKTYLTYKIFHFYSEGIITNSRGTHELKAAVDFQDNGNWIKSDPVQFRVRKTGELSAELLKNYAFYLKDYSYLPNIARSPVDMKKETFIQKLISDLKPSNLSEWLKWKFKCLNIEQGNWPENPGQMEKKLMDIKKNLGQIAYEMAIWDLAGEYEKLGNLKKALKMIQRLKRILPKTITFNIREGDLQYRLKNKKEKLGK